MNYKVTSDYYLQQLPAIMIELTYKRWFGKAVAAFVIACMIAFAAQMYYDRPQNSNKVDKTFYNQIKQK
jgi:hypothetical protein